MKFKLAELKPFAEGLTEILNIELPIKPAYWLGKLLRKIEAELKHFDETRMKLIVKHSTEKDENGHPKVDETTNRYIVDEEAFSKEFIELCEEEIDIDFKPIKLEELGDVKLKPITLAKLEKILEE